MSENFEAILNEAITAAVLASSELMETYGDNGACGFAWVDLSDARSPFVKWCKSQIKLASQGTESPREERIAIQNAERLYGSKHYKKGWTFWNPSKHNAQTVDILEAGADAFAKVLRSHGIEAHANSRLD